MLEGALFNALFAFATIFTGNVAGMEELPRQSCDPSLSNQTIFDFSLPNGYQNGTIDLSEQRGKLTLFVNTATYWGRVTQYHGFNALITDHGAEGMDVIGVPCRQFHNVGYLYSKFEISTLHCKQLHNTCLRSQTMYKYDTAINYLSFAFLLVP